MQLFSNSWWLLRRVATGCLLVALGAGVAPGCGAQSEVEIAEKGSVAQLRYDPGSWSNANAVEQWVRRSMAIVGGYYGHFPVPHFVVDVRPVEGGGVRRGRAIPTDPPTIRVTLGRDVTAAELLHDWVLPHEMIHLALPEVGDEHLWLAEGLATYVEGVARVQAGNLDPVEFWSGLVRQMPKGMPRSGDHGLDQTHTWGRTYWGGALFCLEADIEIHERTANRFGLQDALRAIARESGGYLAQWSIDRVLRTGDEATGVHVLTDLYLKMRDQPVAPDLSALWRRVGIDTSGDRERLDESGAGAALRAAITTARA
jgi:predicted metalloprotease with PDZ domain